MIEKFKSKNLTFLPIAIAVGFMLFCVALGLTASLPALADVDTTWDTKVDLSIEEPVVGQGKTFTLNAVVTTQRTNTYWSYLSLQIVPLKEDGTLDEETAEHLSVATKEDGSYDIDWGNLPTGRQGYTFYPVDGFQGEEKGVWLTFMFLRGTKSYATTNDIRITVKIQADETTPVGKLRFGLLSNAVNEVCFGSTQTPVDSVVGGTAHTDAGILSCTSAEVEVLHPYLELTQESTYQFLVEYQKDSGYYRVAYDEMPEYGEERLVHGVNDSEVSTFVLGQIEPGTYISEFIRNIKPNLIPYVRLFADIDGEEIIVYDRGIYAEPEYVEERIYTGFYIKFGSGEMPWETVYLSVLGDIDGDGWISSSDVADFADIIKDVIDPMTLRIEYRLAAYLCNNGNISEADFSAIKMLVKFESAITDYYWHPKTESEQASEPAVA